MTIVEDSAQKEGKHTEKHLYWKKEGVEIIRAPLPVGDYVLMGSTLMDALERKRIRGIPVKKMDLLGTYDKVVDTKYGIQELCMDVCGTKAQHERFRDELILAKNNNIQLYILVENEESPVTKTITSPYIDKLEELHKWVNPRLFIRSGGVQKYPRATKGRQLMLSCMTMEKKYGVKFVFCRPKEAGEKVIRLLTGEENE